MKDDSPQCMKTIGASDAVRQRALTIQSFMGKASGGSFSEAELDHLRVVVRLTVEFHSYVQLSCVHPSCLMYACESIFSGVDSYRSVTRAYQVLVGATESRIGWTGISVPSLKKQFTLMFGEFDRETDFEQKCRRLLDLVKLQIVFAGVSYD